MTKQTIKKKNKVFASNIPFMQFIVSMGVSQVKDFFYRSPLLSAYNESNVICRDWASRKAIRAGFLEGRYIPLSFPAHALR